MKIIIDIPDFIYDALKEDPDCGTVNLNHIVAQGTVLPEGRSDLIDRKELKEVLKENEWITNTDGGGLEDIIDDMPTVDAIVNTVEVRPHGDWIINPDTRTMKCSRCGAIENADRWLVEDMNYCHCCGADLRGAEK